MRTWVATLACKQGGWAVTAVKHFPTRDQARYALRENKAELVQAGGNKVTSTVRRETPYIGQHTQVRHWCRECKAEWPCNAARKAGI